MQKLSARKIEHLFTSNHQYIKKYNTEEAKNQQFVYHVTII